MATVTPNFNWPVPTSTDLVKDGATAIEALGDSIDASLVDLKGGTTGQVLSKNSNTDMDFVWVTDAAGDITGVTAGVGISGGGTSGTVTVTNSMATAIDAKGDLVAGTGADTFARLGVGTNGQVLLADSAEATGLKWGTPASGSTFSGCLLTNSANISLSNGTTVTLTWDQEVLDSDAYHSTGSNTSRITIPAGKAGKYLVTSKVQYTSNSNGRRIVQIIKNGANLWDFESASPGSTELQLQGVAIINLAEGDYVETTAWQNSGAGLNAQNGSTRYSAFAAYLIGA